ncbi:MAG TPA: hypothetical protein PKK74_02360 [Candidatus Methanoculleus thermohydrogenotrophicum]|nr:hypothetical protein [Candidatus Methanoculleus thermohydrogenotrophicum]HPZ37682.1 hypothetical protein [Candidatus Methanoculleus thermohydrogenotrophicum]HQC91843.1 hypothetical protein [Candidatus Methanoculleus thermohydrogenotrophicum]
MPRSTSLGSTALVGLRDLEPYGSALSDGGMVTETPPKDPLRSTASSARSIRAAGTGATWTWIVSGFERFRELV